MRRNEIFWGAMLVVLGGLFFLRTAGYLGGDIFGWFWPLFITAAGAWILLGGFEPYGQALSGSSFAIGLQGANQASLIVNHHAGRLELGSGASGPDFLRGNSAAALSHSSRLVGDRLEVEVNAGPSLVPFIGPESGRWSLMLNPTVRTTMLVRAGASGIDLDLSELQVTRLDYEGGASSLKVALPAHVDRFGSHIRTGASSILLRVPSGAAARFVITGFGSPSMDPKRFVASGQGVFQSPDYDTAPNRADVTIEGGATSIQID